MWLNDGESGESERNSEIPLDIQRQTIWRKLQIDPSFSANQKILWTHHVVPSHDKVETVHRKKLANSNQSQNVFSSIYF